MTDTGPEPELPEDSQHPEEPEHPQEPEGLDDEAKRRFREALDRKRSSESDMAGGRGGKDSGKVRGAHGPASSRRSFRRRGGG